MCEWSGTGYYDKSPDRISEEELRQYFLYLSGQEGLSDCECDQFFFEQQRQWATLERSNPFVLKKWVGS
jgi:hypothetical protein